MYSLRENTHFREKFSEKALKALLIGDTPTGYLLWHPQKNRFMNSRHVRCNEKMIYKSLKESPEKPEIRISENTEKSEISEEKTLTLIRDQRSQRYQSFPSQKEENYSKKGAHKEETEP